MASLPIASMSVGTFPPERPIPRLSNAITRWCSAMPSMTRGSQSSSTAIRWCRNTTGTPPSGPSSRYANGVPFTSIIRVGTFFQFIGSPVGSIRV